MGRKCLGDFVTVMVWLLFWCACSESSGSLQPLRTSTPTSQAATARKHSTTKSTYTMSLGLAAILQGRENSSTTRSLLRPVTSCPVVPADSVATLSGGATAVSLANLGDGSANSPSLFGKLISTGYSLLWNKSNSPISSASSPVSSHESSPADVAKPLRKPTASEILPAEGTTGVLGAIATFRKNGILWPFSNSEVDKITVFNKSFNIQTSFSCISSSVSANSFIQWLLPPSTKYITWM